MVICLDSPHSLLLPLHPIRSQYSNHLTSDIQSDAPQSLQSLLSNMSLNSSFITPSCKTTLSRRCVSEPIGGIPAIPRRNRERDRVMLDSLEKEKKKLLEGLEKELLEGKKEVSPVCLPRSLDRVFAEEGKKNKRSSTSRGLTPILKIHTWSYRAVPEDAESIDFVQTLPLEMSVLLLQKYIAPDDLLSCRLVNKYWNQMCDLRSIRSQWRGYLSDKRKERLRVGKENYLSPVNYISPQGRRMSLSRGPMSPIQIAQDSPTLLWRVFHTPAKTPDNTTLPKHPTRPKVPSIIEDNTPTPEKQSRHSVPKQSKLDQRNPLQTLAYGTPNSQTSSVSRTSSRTSLSSLNSSKYLTPDAVHFPVSRSHTRSHTRSKRSPATAEISPPLQLNFNTCDGFKVPRTPTSPAPTTRSASRPIASQKSRQRLRRL